MRMPVLADMWASGRAIKVSQLQSQQTKTQRKVLVLQLGLTQASDLPQISVSSMSVVAKSTNIVIS
eukprot:scaffold235496_cov51-Prasinocladus_malaysianus.AAC.1